MLIRIAQYFMQAFKQTKGACDMDIPTKKNETEKKPLRHSDLLNAFPRVSEATTTKNP